MKTEEIKLLKIMAETENQVIKNLIYKLFKPLNRDLFGSEKKDLDELIDRILSYLLTRLEISKQIEKIRKHNKKC